MVDRTVPPDSAGSLPVVVIGAGPVGLAAAAHLHQRGLVPLVLEAGDRVGAAVREWGHVRTFTPWRYVVDTAAEELLAASGWSGPDPDVAPTGAELVERYLEPLAAALRGSVRTGARVVAATRDGLDGSRSPDREERHSCSACSTPAACARSGPARSSTRPGPGHSRTRSARGELGTDLRALVRSGAIEHVPGFSVTSLDLDGATVTVTGRTADGPRRIRGARTVVAATGFRPDLAMLGEVRLDLDPAFDAPTRLAPLIDPAVHSCGTVPPHGHRELAHPEPPPTRSGWSCPRPASARPTSP